MTPIRPLLAALAVAALPLCLSTPAHASEGWRPDAVMVMPLDAEDMTAADRELLAALDAEPGDVLPVAYVQVDAPLDSGTYEAAVWKGTDVQVPVASPLFAPAGPSSSDGDKYPEYGSMLAWDDAEHSELPVADRPEERVFVDEPGAVMPPQGDDPDLLVWVSDEHAITTVLGEETAWVRVGFGLNDVWVDARRLVGPDEFEPVAEFRADNLASLDPTEDPTPTSTPTAEPSSPGPTSAPADEPKHQPAAVEPADGEGGLPVAPLLGVAGLAVAGGLLFSRRRTEKDAE